MRVLITGAEGQLGRALQRLAPAGAELFPTSHRDCDVTDQDAVARAFDEAQPDVVFNACAYNAVDRAEDDEAAARAVNAVAVGLLARSAAGRRARLVHVSTDYVFDGAAGRPYAPDAATNPLSAYGRSKRHGELAALEGDPRCLVVRTAWLYGGRGSNFVHTMLRLMNEQEVVRTVDDQVGTPTYAPSLAEALWDLVAAGTAGIHHYTDAGVASRYDFAVAIAEEARGLGLLKAAPEVRPVSTAGMPAPARRPPFAVLDKSACWRELGWTPPHWRVNLRTMLREVADHG